MRALNRPHLVPGVAAWCRALACGTAAVAAGPGEATRATTVRLAPAAGAGGSVPAPATPTARAAPAAPTATAAPAAPATPSAPADRAVTTPREAAAARVHAQDIADVFHDACLVRLGEPEGVADWALHAGFVIDTSAVQQVAAAMRQRGDQGNVFVRPGGDSLLLISTADPVNCLVMGLDPVDGPRLRGRMEALMAGWTRGTATAEHERNGDYDQEGPHRSLSWMGVVDGTRYRMTVVSPLGVARGTAVMGIAMAPRREAKP